MAGCGKFVLSCRIHSNNLACTARSKQTRLISKRLISALSSFDSAKIEVTPAGPSQLKQKPDVSELAFGKHFTDHMLTIRWKKGEGWDNPKITPLEPFQMHPGSKVLHYAQELFEGMKAYRGADDQIRLFRPMHNMIRMNVSAKRACLPNFDGGELIKCIRKLVQIDQEWVPHSESSSLYIRPTMIGVEPTLGVGSSNEVLLFVLLGPVGPYFSASGIKPVNLLADPQFVRAWQGGCGYAKMGSNYAPTMYTQTMAEKAGCQQCLWLFGEDDEITEVGAMNIFVLFKKPGSGELELVTPPLDSGVILPGVTRRSVLEMTREWNEFEVSERRVTMKEIVKAREEGRLVEMFGVGTAAIVSPVGNIMYRGNMMSIPYKGDDASVSKRLLTSMSDIYYGRVKHPWAMNIENWEEFSAKEMERLADYEDSIRQHIN